MSRIHQPQNPAKLLDFLIAHLGLKNDAALSSALSMTAPQISKIRHGYNRVSGDTLLVMHDTTGLSIQALRRVLHDVEAPTELAAA